ncbi:MAG: Holliday junction branch migration protein RuvA [Candidatus Eiseniibacteriota bacterium]|nr:MAG: Holliday junction branch migration protein RuvA [Candidatus Eisenbacteria bacterium]
MIFSLKGTLLEKNPTRIVVDVSGIGYGVNVPLSTFDRLGDVGTPVELLTHLHVREDSLDLYGFATAEERQLFELLILVSGIGPRLALGILSGSEAHSFAEAVASGNLAMLTTISGVGKKLAERIVVELKEKIGVLVPVLEPVAAAGESPHYNDALLALISLGLTRASASKALRSVAAEEGGRLSLEEMIRRALSLAGR